MSPDCQTRFAICSNSAQESRMNLARKLAFQTGLDSLKLGCRFAPEVGTRGPNDKREGAATEPCPIAIIISQMVGSEDFTPPADTQIKY